VHAHGAAASGFVNVEIAVGQLLLVAVEIDADQFAVAVDERASRIAADRVDGIDEVERWPDSAERGAPSTHLEQ
jgi:hypothetical protein